MLRQTMTILCLIALSVSASAQSNAPSSPAREIEQHKHGEKGPRGGVLQDIAGYEGEFVVVGGKVALYLTDETTKKPVPPDGMKANVVFVQGNTRKGAMTLQPASGRLEGAGRIPPGTDAVITIILADGKSSQARFELGGH